MLENLSGILTRNLKKKIFVSSLPEGWLKLLIDFWVFYNDFIFCVTSLGYTVPVRHNDFYRVSKVERHGSASGQDTLMTLSSNDEEI